MNEDTVTTMFPIELLDYDICTGCPEMEIENHAMVMYSGNSVINCENRLRCKHVDRCRHLSESLSTREKHGL